MPDDPKKKKDDAKKEREGHLKTVPHLAKALEDTSSIDREMQDMLGSLVDRPKRTISMGAGNPEVLAPPQLSPDHIPVSGSPMLSTLVSHYQKRLPWLGQYVKGVSESPTPSTVDAFTSSKIPWNQWNRTNLAGIYDRDTRDIGIKPGLSPHAMEWVLAHELGHALGLEEDDRRLRNVEGLGMMRADAREMYEDPRALGPMEFSNRNLPLKPRKYR